MGLGSLTAPRLIVRLLPVIAGFPPLAGPSHVAPPAATATGTPKSDEPSGAPDAGPIHSNPETVAFVILAGLMTLAVLAIGSEFPAFRRYRRW